jgi:hypothetical protein
MECYLVVGYGAGDSNVRRHVLGMYLDLESARIRQKTVCGEEWTYSKINDRAITTVNGSFVTVVTKLQTGDMNQAFLEELC